MTALRHLIPITAVAAVAAVGVGVVSMSGWAAAADPVTTPIVCASFPLSTTNWVTTVALSKFDPALGTLQSVSITATSKIQGRGQAESLDAAPALISASVAAVGTLKIPSAPSPQSVNPKITQTLNASAFDGLPDYAGTSGFDTGTVNTFQAFAPVTLTGNDMVPYVGAGNWVADATATGTSSASGAGNMISVFTTRAGLDVCVAYVYLPPPPTTTLPPTTLPPTTVAQLPPLPPTTVPPEIELPKTGGSSASIVWPAALFTGMGLLITSAVRRRRRPA